MARHRLDPIRLLSPQEYESALSYLDREPLCNIWLIHTLRTYGLESDQATFWGAFHDGRLEGVLAADNCWDPRIGYLVGENPEVLARLGKVAHRSAIKVLKGKKPHIQHAIVRPGIAARIDIKHVNLNLYKVEPERFVRYYECPVRAATEQDIPLLIELYREYEFRSRGRTDGEIEREIRRAMDESGVYFLFESEGRCVSAARVYPETDRAGLIGAARTLPEFRGQGIYLSVRTACFEYLFKRGKIGLGSFVDTNVSMHRVLAKQGGLIIAELLNVHFRARPPLGRRILPRRVRRWGRYIIDNILRRGK